jgi:hypothetical protein
VTALEPGEAAAVAAIAGAAVVEAGMVRERHHVVRAVLADGRAVVVKRPRRDEGGWDRPPSEEARARFANERACLELLASCGADVAPGLLGVSAEPELLVMEDLPPGPSLASQLLGDDADVARASVMAYGRALATLHASTVGREAAFGGRGAVSPWVEWAEAGVDALLATAAELGLTFDGDGVRDDCASVIAELGDAGPWRTFVHGDPCPDNTRIEEGTGRFRIFDFEHSTYGHALTDASYVIAPFPTCWCVGRVPEDLSALAVAAYREVLADAIPLALDDRAWNDGLAVALAAPVISRGGVLAKALVEDRAWGTAGMRVRLRQWIRSFLATAEASGRFPDLCLLADGLGDELARQWPEAELPDYPGLPTGASTVVTAPDWWTPGH